MSALAGTVDEMFAPGELHRDSDAITGVLRAMLLFHGLEVEDAIQRNVAGDAEAWTYQSEAYRELIVILEEGLIAKEFELAKIQRDCTLEEDALKVELRAAHAGLRLAELRLELKDRALQREATTRQWRTCEAMF